MSCVLISIRKPADVAVARGLLDGLLGRFEFFILFGDKNLREQFGPLELPWGVDAAACLLNANRFGLFVTFSSLQSSTHDQDVILVQFFECIGIPTLEIQHTWLQEGCYPLGSSPARDGLTRSTQPGSGPWSYAAGRFVAWGGPDGIGYPRPRDEERTSLRERNDLLLVTSAFEWEGYTEKDRYAFAFAVLKLAQAHPELQFAWVPRAEELAHQEGGALLTILAEYEQPNLYLELREPLPSLLARCRAGLSMASVALLEYERAGRGVALYSGTKALGVHQGAGTPCFSNSFELEALLPTLLAEPQGFRVELGIEPFKPETLEILLGTASEGRSLVPHWREAALRHIDLLNSSEVLRRVRRIEKRIPDLERRLDRIPGSITRVVQRIGVLQRSTLAYKALKVMKRLGAGGSEGD